MEPCAIDDLWVEDLPARQRSRRIAVVTETYPPEVNGVAMSLARVVEGLHQRNHDLQLVRPRRPAAEPGPGGGAVTAVNEVLTGGWPIPMYPHLRLGVPCKRALVRLWTLRRPDVVHIATEGPLGWSALQAAKRLALPVTSDFRTNFHAYGRHYKIGWLARPIMGYLRKFHNATLATMVPTEALRAELSLRGFERLSVVSRGVDTQLFDPARRSPALRRHWGVADEALVVLCVGRLAPEKNLEAAAAAFESLRSQHPGCRLVFVGDGPHDEALKHRCPDAVFAGQRSGEDLATHYASADLFLFPSLTETFGNVTTEAMASGLGVVAFDRAAAGQLIRSRHNGLLVSGAAERDFVQAAVTAAQDRARLARWGASARNSVAALDWSEIVLRFEGVLEAAIEAAGPRRADVRNALRRQAA